MIELRDNWQDAGAWDRFVERQGEARFCHFFSYAAVLRCYGYLPRNICFLKNGELIGVLPATQVNTLLSGRKLVSQPFLEYGGLLLEPELSEYDVAAIFSGLKAYCHKHLGIDLIEMHGNHGIPSVWRDNWTVSAIPQHIAVLSLSCRVDELWHNVLRYSARKAVNQARDHGLDVVFECDENIIWYERREPVQRAHDFANEVGGHLGVARRRVELGMPEQDLNHANVDVLLQQMGSEAVAQRVRCH